MGINKTILSTGFTVNSGGTPAISGGAASITAAITDESDSTWISYQGAAPWDYDATHASDSPTSGYRRHQVRIRVRSKAFQTPPLQDLGTAYGTIGTTTTDQLQWRPSSETPATVTGAYKLIQSLADANNALAPLIELSGTDDDNFIPRIIQLDMQVEERLIPTFTGAVKDAAGNTIGDMGEITDTTRPRLTFASINLDSLSSRSYVAKIDLYDGGGFVENVYTGSAAGAAPSSITADSLPDTGMGEFYKATLTVSSTIGNDLENISATFTRDFTLAAALDPTFVADVLDGLGVSQAGGTIDNTSKPKFVFDDLDYLGMDPVSWSVSVENTVTEAIVFTASGSGEPPAQIVSSALPSGTYEATLEASSNEGGEGSFSANAFVGFEIDFTPPPPGNRAGSLSEIRLQMSSLQRKRGERST